LSDTQYVMVIDLVKCIGCHACTVACQIENDVPKGFRRSMVIDAEVGQFPTVHSVKLPRLCNHCADAPCEKVCPTGATYHLDSTIQVDEAKCIGCEKCIAACPYKARFMHPVSHKASKCTFCYHRASSGLMPACISTCVAQARYFGDARNPGSDVSRMLATRPHQVLSPGSGTRPNVYYVGRSPEDGVAAVGDAWTHSTHK